MKDERLKRANERTNALGIEEDEGPLSHRFESPKYNVVGFGITLSAG